MERRAGWAWIAAMTMLCTSGAARADMFSPGELARPHASLEGLSNCTRCHAQGEQLSPQRCNACHTEIAAELSSKRGFHGKLPPSGQAACQSCHHEHRGRDNSLIDWGPRGEASFDHASTGFPLRGKHAAQKCGNCHQTKRILDPDILKLIQARPGMKTFLGLQPACTACHFDEHRGQMQGSCSTCHDEKGWRPAPGFDHGETGFALKGAHKRVACEKCHAAEKDTTTAANAFPAPVSMTFARFGDLPHAACTDCHADPHKGQFQQRCESCHTVESWKKIRDAGSRAFHAKTRFPLVGAHEDVDCEKCHGPFPGQRAVFRGLAHDRCTDCHADAHLGQIDLPASGPTCEKCHGMDAFLPARYEVADHARSRYPLEGAHQVAACNGCHAPQPILAQKIPARTRQMLEKRRRPLAFSLAVFDLMPKTAKCDSCHADPHGGQFSKNGSTECAACHKVESFHAVKFDHDRDTSFPLTGKHPQVPCNGCHASAKAGQPQSYRGTPKVCESCHADVHAGQFAPEPSAPTACARCHTTASFEPTLFTHAPPFTAFLLKGKHEQVACRKCHVEVEARTAEGAAVKVARFKPLPTTCAGCHADPHQGRFAGMQP